MYRRIKVTCRRIKVTCWMASVLLVVLASGCGEDEEEEKPLSEAVIGTWESMEQDVTFIGEAFKCTPEMSLTFYGDGRFDLVTDLAFASLDGESIGAVKLITPGNYAAFEGSIAFRPETSEVRTTPSEMQVVIEPLVGPLFQDFENEVFGTKPAGVAGDILTLDDEQWRKI